MKRKLALVTGGSGFVGCHLVQYLVSTGTYEEIILVDLVPPINLIEKVIYIQTDLRQPVDPLPFTRYTSGMDVTIYHLAAISKIPGYPVRDYFATNILGAHHANQLARDLNCRVFVYTSTIAVYGAGEDLKEETTLPMPDNPYGISKLVAEEIHKTWQAEAPAERSLHILRPGIIFGKGEDANFTRLFQAMGGGVLCLSRPEGFSQSGHLCQRCSGNMLSIRRGTERPYTP